MTGQRTRIHRKRNNEPPLQENRLHTKKWGAGVPAQDFMEPSALKHEMARGRYPPKIDRHGFPIELLDQIIGEWDGPQTGQDGLFQTLTGALVDRLLEAELSHHLGYERGENTPASQTNRRNGTTGKTVRTKRGTMQITVPRDRDGTFEPILVPKHTRHFDGFDDQILSLYARGMSDREIQAHLYEVYGTEVSADLISRATNAVLDELNTWQNRSLESAYPIVYLDALMTKIRDTGVVESKAVYLAVGVQPDGMKDVLGMWIQNTEGAKFWMTILAELKTRGIQDILVLCADGLTGLPEAVEAVFPKTIFQTCVVHMIRGSTRFVSYQDRKKVCADLRLIYTAPNEQAAKDALEACDDKWGTKYPQIGKSWRARWAEITPFLSFPPEIRRAVYTTNTIEALNRQIRRVLKTKGHLPTEESARKLVYLNIRRAANWKRAPPHWLAARQQFEIFFPGRLPQEVVN